MLLYKKIDSDKLIGMMNKMKRGFTLIEIIVVIIIVGVLAAMGLSQYSLTVEKSRVAEARVRIGVMSKLASEYYLNNGTFVGITNENVGVDATCHSTDYYKYSLDTATATYVFLFANRCTTGGKSPQGPGYILRWCVYSPGYLVQHGYYNTDGSWVTSSDWGGCCR